MSKSLPPEAQRVMDGITEIAGQRDKAWAEADRLRAELAAASARADREAAGRRAALEALDQVGNLAGRLELDDALDKAWRSKQIADRIRELVTEGHAEHRVAWGEGR